ncbi:MAG: cytochrome b5-like heme/steroid binding domain-containing protein [Actinomycetes bacterium]
MSSRKTVTRILATGAALPIALAAVLAAPAASAATDTSKPSAKYTMAQVKKHNKATDCWSVVGKNVYKITAWIPKHPGGPALVVSMCGKNGTALYNSKHGADPISKGILAKYKIGTL